MKTGKLIVPAVMCVFLMAGCVSTTTGSITEHKRDDKTAAELNYQLGARYYQSGKYTLARDRLLLAMRDNAALSNLIKDASAAVKQANQELEKGRDVLLEANSCRPAEAQKLKSMIEKAEMESDLPAYLDSVFDAFGVNSETHSEAALVLKPSRRMREPFPHLQDDGITITWVRDKALAHEDMQFITWEHDMVQQVMERVLTGEKGNSTLALLRHPDYPLGDFFLECLFVANVPARLQKYMGRCCDV